MIFLYKLFLTITSYLFKPFNFIRDLSQKIITFNYDLKMKINKKIQSICSHPKIYGTNEKDFINLNSMSVKFIRVCPVCGLKESSYLAKNIKDNEGFVFLVSGSNKKVQPLKRGKVYRLVKETERNY